MNASWKTTIGHPSRTEQIKDVFQECDTDQNGYLRAQDMRPVANVIGFQGTDVQWDYEFRCLCADHGINPDDGMNFIQFQRLLEDTSEKGCFATETELKDILREAHRINFAALSTSFQGGRDLHDSLRKENLDAAQSANGYITNNYGQPSMPITDNYVGPPGLVRPPVPDMPPPSCSAWLAPVEHVAPAPASFPEPAAVFRDRNPPFSPRDPPFRREAVELNSKRPAAPNDPSTGRGYVIPAAPRTPAVRDLAAARAPVARDWRENEQARERVLGLGQSVTIGSAGELRPEDLDGAWEEKSQGQWIRVSCYNGKVTAQFEDSRGKVFNCPVVIENFEGNSVIVCGPFRLASFQKDAELGRLDPKNAYVTEVEWIKLGDSRQAHRLPRRHWIRYGNV